MGGIGGTAGVVTSAAVIMVAVFSILATLSIVQLKMLGVGLAAAVVCWCESATGVDAESACRECGEAAGADRASGKHVDAGADSTVAR